MLIIGYEDKSSKYIKCNSAKVRDIRWDLIKREYEKYNNIFSDFMQLLLQMENGMNQEKWDGGVYQVQHQNKK